MFIELSSEKIVEKPSEPIWFLLPILFLTGQVLLAPQLFIDPRFWAEEGSAYYSAALQTDFLRYVFTFVFNGNYQFLTNLLTGLAAAVSPVYAPWVTTYISVGIFAGVVLQFGLFLKANGVPCWLSVLAMLAWTMSPSLIEISATATNVQWIAALSILILCLSDLKGKSPARVFWVSAWVIACGLTGIPSVLLAPFYILQAFLTRSKNHFLLSVLLGLCALVQLGVMIEFGLSSRDPIFGLSVLFAPMLLQTIFTPMLGFKTTDAIGSLVRGPSGGIALLAVAAIAALFVGFLLIANRFSKQSVLLVGLWAFVSVLQTIGSIGGIEEKLAQISALGGARYFATGYLALIILLSLASRHAWRPVIVFLLALILVQGLTATPSLRASMAAVYPSWSEEIIKCPRPCEVPIWPTPWVAKLP
ncbi:hypothetical protein GF108_00870 [Phyllobacterium sp. SYP-B3895]|uniref:hypothetical protein n=1 Tax=Phyllobacterium sp. SYP-B3895 TaxID=2663240 RepID=UPI0012999D40|nr:hypothetical protein [Phyllobacterium sp. SYP-B3895]MRG54133.1 hypothetical protein [Phyllobacterium sp. SYP-B3895]